MCCVHINVNLSISIGLTGGAFLIQGPTVSMHNWMNAEK